MKQEGPSEAESKVTLNCPVCKKSLAEKETLHDHLNTHPKEQVIEALIQLRVACEENNVSGSDQGCGSSSAAAGISTPRSDFRKIFEPSSPAAQSDHEIDEDAEEERAPSAGTQYTPPPCLPPMSSSHILSLPQFLAGPNSVAQFIQVPVVTSAVPSTVQPSPAQTSMLLYSPFMCPPNTSEPSIASVSDPMNPSHLLQLIAGSNLLRPPFSIIHTRPGSEIHQPAAFAMPPNFSSVRAEGPSSHIIYMPANPVGPSAPAAMTEEAEKDWDDSNDAYEAPLEELCKPMVVSREDLQCLELQQQDDTCGSTEQEEGSAVQASVVSEEEQQAELECVQDSDYTPPENVKPPSHRAEREMLSPPKKRRSLEELCKQLVASREETHHLSTSEPCEQDEDSPQQDADEQQLIESEIAKESQDGEYIVPECIEDISQEPQSILPCQTSPEREMLSPPKKRRCTEWSSADSPGAHSTSSAEISARIRSDFCQSPPSAIIEERSGDWPILPIVQLKEEEEQSFQYCVGAQSYPASPANGMGLNSVNGISTSTHESVISEPCPFKKEQLSSRICDGEARNKKSPHTQSVMSTADDHLQADEGMIIVKPNSSLSKEEDIRDDCSMGRPGTPPCDSGPPSPYQKSLDSPSTPLNIQTDETMPPRGELSEQESIGGNSSSMWSVPAYHTTWPSPVVSYDLTARESWPGSDVSDTEGSGVESHLSQFKTAPSFTNTLQPFLSKGSSEITFSGGSSFSSRLQHQTFAESHEAGKTPSNSNSFCKDQSKELKKSEAKKTPAKPRVYRCKECSSEFSSLSLRRQHPCDLMKNSSNCTAITVLRMASDLKGLSNDISSVPGSSSEDLGVQSKLKKKQTRKPKAAIKKDVIVEDQLAGQANFAEQCQISKQKRESNSELRMTTQTVLSVATSEVFQTAFELVNANMVFEEEPARNDPLKSTTVTLQCQKCDDVFNTSKLLSQHMSSKHKGQKYQCTTCGESFENERGYYDHLMIHPLECQLCGKTFKRRKYLNLHMKWHMETKPHKCETCGKSFVTKQKLDEHLNTHTGNAPIKCSDCDKTFKRYSNLIQHRNRHHLNVKPKTKDYVCHCGEVLPSKKKLEWHKEIHDDKPKSCHYCSEKFLHTVSLTRHIRRTHNTSYVPKKERETENIECPVCRVVILKSSLATHMKIHSGERSFPCHICGKDFSTKWNLQLHRWTHASRSSRPFKCTLCKASFIRKQDYFGHMHSHRNVRPYTCNHCGCQFVRKYNCYRHMREHEENKKFVCTICNKSFHRRYYLNDHMRVHNGTRPFTCHICGKASTSKSNHNKHVRIHHAREPQNTEI